LPQAEQAGERKIASRKWFLTEEQKTQHYSLIEEDKIVGSYRPHASETQQLVLCFPLVDQIEYSSPLCRICAAPY